MKMGKKETNHRHRQTLSVIEFCPHCTSDR